MQELSILIPVYNSCCTRQVEQLGKLCDEAGIQFEIIVADDGSDNPALNKPIEAIPHCRLIVKDTNSGSAATRNLLAREASYEWLLFIDADVDITRKDYIQRYLKAAGGDMNATTEVVNGGIAIGGYHPKNLRWLYEKHAEPQHDAPHRQANRYREFRSTNFLIRRDVMLRCPFDERFKASGYEDVFFGRSLSMAKIDVCHIDNPVTMNAYEPNDHFIAKTERQLQTLHRFSAELDGYSDIIRWNRRLSPILSVLHRPLSAMLPSLRSHLSGDKPKLFLYNIYRLFYYIKIDRL